MPAPTIAPEKRYLRLNDIGAYKKAFALSNDVWAVVLRWDHLARQTVGSQWIRSTDSVSANLAEGFGRYGKKDKIKFYRYSFASVTESLDWLLKARVRKLIAEDQYQQLFDRFQELPREINAFIRFTNQKLSE